MHIITDGPGVKDNVCKIHGSTRVSDKRPKRAGAGKAKAQLPQLHAAILDLLVLMNRPQQDDILLKEAGLSLDRALFPLLVGIERFGPIGVVALAEGSGRDHTTVSRQVAKLVELGLVERRPSAVDARVHQAVVTKAGRRMTDALAAARQRLAAPVLAKWSEKDLETLVRLLRRFVDGIAAPERD
jgi:DNA-binding MarR family transcriptional regulator